MGLLNFGWDLKNFDKLTDKSWTPSENIDLYQSPYIFFILKIFMKYISFHELLEFSKAALMPVLLERVEDIIWSKIKLALETECQSSEDPAH